MTQTYRTDDLARWGTGQGFNLSPAQVDNNFWDLVQRMLVQEDRVIPAGIDYFSISGNMMYVHLTDGAVLGPYELPIATFKDRGVWAPDTAYSAMDTFSINGGLYVVTLAHTSAATFDPDANDGAGHNYYSLMIQTPDSMLPAGGASQMVLQKFSATDYDVAWGYHLPLGGTLGQTIVKQSSAPDFASWRFMDAADVEFTPATGSTLTSDTVADALEEIAAGGITDASDVPYTPSTGSGLTSDNVADALNEIGSSTTNSVGLHTIWMPASAMVPQLTNGAALGSAESPSNKTMVVTMDFDKTTSEYAQFSIAMPRSWNRGPIQYRLFWSHGPTGAYDVVMQMQAVAVMDYGSLDAAWGTPVSVTDTGPSSGALYVTSTSADLTVDGSPQPGKLTFFRLYRDAGSSTDTLDIDCRVIGVQIFYTTETATDNV